MNQIKICPACHTEYLSHVRNCADCGADLLLPKEYGIVQEKKMQLKEKAVEDSVVIREGDLGWLSELRTVLMDAGIPCVINSEANCRKGCCGDTCQLMVSSADRETAQERIEEYFIEMNPELRASNELIRAGKCPACGSPLGSDKRECPDCGLPLLIIEEE